MQVFVDFFKKYYVPNNATLVICGDFDPKYARTSIEKYYGPLRAGPEIPRTFPPEAKQTEAVYRTVSDPLAPTPLALISFDIPPDFWERYRSDVESISAEDLKKTTRSLLVDQAVQIVVVGRADKLRKELAGFGEVRAYDTDLKRVD